MLLVYTLNGILFYAHIVTANAEAYFLPFKTPNFITVFISWLNLDIGFDICFSVLSPVEDHNYKALIRLVFPAYVVILVIIVVVASEYSPRFAKIIGNGNPVAVLATMILLSYAKLLNAILASFSVFYWKPAYGSSNLDITVVGNINEMIEELNNTTKFKVLSYFWLVVNILVLLLCVIYITLVFSWQWLLRYQDKTLLKWVKYQKLHHFLEPYHAPYIGKYRYWTGLLLLVRAVFYVIALLKFSIDPRVNLIAVILIVGGLILLKGVIVNIVYKNFLLDVIETATYFNLIALSALTLYNLETERNQVNVVAGYTCTSIIFILLLGVIMFHVLCYTRLYKCSIVEKAFKWISFNNYVNR